MGGVAIFCLMLSKLSASLAASNSLAREAAPGDDISLSDVVVGITCKNVSDNFKSLLSFFLFMSFTCSCLLHEFVEDYF